MIDIVNNQIKDDPKTMGAYFPRTYLTGLFRFLKRNSDLFQVITYNDLSWENSEESHGSFQSEYRSWSTKINSNSELANKIYLLIQYDGDSRPDRTMGLLSDPHHDGIPVNIMIFNKRIDRKLLKNTGLIQYTDYDIDDELLLAAQSQGSVIGYHSNANERGGFCVEGAMSAFDEDISDLRKRFNINFYTAHGGVAGTDGVNNNGLPFPDRWKGQIRWVHNGSSPMFDGVFSDGGHNNKSRDPSKRDLRDFVKMLSPGKRYRILLHPQYYDVNPKISQRYTGTHWYDSMMSNYTFENNYNPWHDFKMPSHKTNKEWRRLLKI